MQQVDLNLARADLSRLIDDAVAGEEIIISRDGQPVARLLALVDKPVKQKRILGLLAGQFTVPDNFDDPLPDDLLDLFEGR